MSATNKRSLSSILENYYFPRAQKVRSEKTRQQYRFALANFTDTLKPRRGEAYQPTRADLTDDNLLAMSHWMQEQRLPDGRPRFAVKTINERVGRISALWTFLARKHKVKTWPTVSRVPEPQRVPVAWSPHELETLIAYLWTLTGPVGPIAACSFWVSLHLVLWDTGERIGALRKCELAHVDWDGGWLMVPAENRKGKRRDRIYKLREETLAALRSIQYPRRKYIWDWPFNELYLWRKYKSLRNAAGLATDSRSSFHRMRRSVATHYEAAGGNATELLGHSDRRVTKQSYLDERFLKTPQAVDRLFPLASAPTELRG